MLSCRWAVMYSLLHSRRRVVQPFVTVPLADAAQVIDTILSLLLVPRPDGLAPLRRPVAAPFAGSRAGKSPLPYTWL
jgi:hypothetical protein